MYQRLHISTLLTCLWQERGHMVALDAMEALYVDSDRAAVRPPKMRGLRLRQKTVRMDTA